MGVHDANGLRYPGGPEKQWSRMFFAMLPDYTRIVYVGTASNVQRPGYTDIDQAAVPCVPQLSSTNDIEHTERFAVLVPPKRGMSVADYEEAMASAAHYVGIDVMISVREPAIHMFDAVWHSKEQFYILTHDLPGCCICKRFWCTCREGSCDVEKSMNALPACAANNCAAPGMCWCPPEPFGMCHPYSNPRGCLTDSRCACVKTYKCLRCTHPTA